MRALIASVHDWVVFQVEINIVVSWVQTVDFIWKNKRSMFVHN